MTLKLIFHSIYLGYKVRERKAILAAPFFSPDRVTSRWRCSIKQSRIMLTFKLEVFGSETVVLPSCWFWRGCPLSRLKLVTMAASRPPQPQNVSALPAKCSEYKEIWQAQSGPTSLKIPKSREKYFPTRDENKANAPKRMTIDRVGKMLPCKKIRPETFWC